MNTHTHTHTHTHHPVGGDKPAHRQSGNRQQDHDRVKESDTHGGPNENPYNRETEYIRTLHRHLRKTETQLTANRTHPDPGEAHSTRPRVTRRDLRSDMDNAAPMHERYDEPACDPRDPLMRINPEPDPGGSPPHGGDVDFSWTDSDSGSGHSH